jgi:phage baseplate assembly protein W
MTDVAHFCGNDLSVDATGDLLTVDGPAEVRQRILRRLLTTQGDYLWNLDYGAGLPAALGQPTNVARLQAVVRAQMYQETAVARTPLPVVVVQALDQTTVLLTVTYVDAPSDSTQTIGPITLVNQ